MRSTLLALAGSGCLLLAAPAPPAPPSVDSGSAGCDPDARPGAYGCDGDRCATSCTDASSCKEGAVCTFAACEVACAPKDCAHGLTCESPPLNECKTKCWTDADCRGSNVCCIGEAYGSGVCDHYQWCYEP
jgi:hypothetical protein